MSIFVQKRISDLQDSDILFFQTTKELKWLLQFLRARLVYEGSIPNVKSAVINAIKAARNHPYSQSITITIPRVTNDTRQGIILRERREFLEPSQTHTSRMDFVIIKDVMNNSEVAARPLHSSGGVLTIPAQEIASAPRIHLSPVFAQDQTDKTKYETVLRSAGPRYFSLYIPPGGTPVNPAQEQMRLARRYYSRAPSDQQQQQNRAQEELRQRLRESREAASALNLISQTPNHVSEAARTLLAMKHRRR